MPISRGNTEEEVAVLEHPLQDVFEGAVRQAMFGKGVRHGGAATPFLDQPWTHYARMHGRGFLTGQAAKKLEEAASTREGEAFLTEMRGALVYIGMAILYEQQKMCTNAENKQPAQGRITPHTTFEDVGGRAGMLKAGDRV